MNLLIEMLFLVGLVLAIVRPVALLYVLVFILLEPSRRFALGNYPVFGSANFKYSEMVMLLVYLGAVVRQRRAFLTCLRPSLLVFLLFATLSVVRGALGEGYAEAAFNMFRPFAAMGMCVAVPMLFKRPGDFMPLLRFFLVTMLLAGTIDFLEVLHINPLSFWVADSEYRTMSVLGGTQGSMLAMIFLYILCTYRFIGRHRFAATVCMMYAVLLAVLSGSRGVWMGITGSVIVLVWFLPFQRKVVLCLSVMLLALFIVVFLQSFYIERYDMPLFERMKTVFDPDEGTTRWRLYAWRQMIEDIRERPILGWSFGSVPSFEVYETGFREVVAPHNEYLKIARYTGLAGLAAFFWLLAGILTPAFRFVQRHADSRLSYQVLALLLCFIMNALISIVTQQFTTIDIAPIIWAIPGCMAVYLFTERETKAAGTA